MRVAVVFDTPYSGYTPADHLNRMRDEIAAWDQTEPEQEYQIGWALAENGHDVVFLGVNGDPAEFLSNLKRSRVDIAFNCAETFNGADRLDYLVPSLLEAEGIRYTGASPLALMLTRNKALSKKVLAHHGVCVPRFVTYRTGEDMDEDPTLRFPVIVKPLQLDASVGVSQASVVRDLEGLAERVKFVHERFSHAAIAEEFIEGRELYVSVLGHGKKLEILPPVEMVFGKAIKPEQRIATATAKWDEDYRERNGIKNVLARPISRAAQQKIADAVTTAYRALWLRDYARFDIRLSPDDEVWILEANANPYLCYGHEISKSAERAGMDHKDLVDRIVREALERE